MDRYKGVWLEKGHNEMAVEVISTIKENSKSRLLINYPLLYFVLITQEEIMT